MPLSMPYPNPYSIETLQNTYIWCSFLALDFASKSGRIVMSIHPDRDSAYAGKPPIATISYTITPEGRAAVMTLIQDEIPYQPATYDYETDPPTLLTPEIPYSPPVYGEPVIIPAFPSFDELMAGNAEAFASVATTVYTLCLSQPEFAGASVIQ